MANPQRLQRRKNGRYYLRAKVPDHLVSAIGKGEIVKSLGTADRKTAIERLKLESIEVDRQFEAAARTTSGKVVNSISREELDRIAILWLRDEDKKRADAELREHFEFGERQEAIDGLKQDIAQFKDDSDPSTLASVQVTIRRIEEENAFQLLSDSDSYWYLHRLIQRAGIEASRRSLARLRGKFDAVVFDSLFEEQAAPRVDSVAGHTRIPTLAELVEEHENDPSRSGLSEKSQIGYKVISRALRELLGDDVRVDAISRDECKRVRDILVSLPPNASKRFPHMTVEEASAHAKENGLAALHPTTINGYLGNLSTLFKYAQREGYITQNPAEQLRVENTRRSRDDRRQPFSTAQLNKIFSAPLYTGCVDDVRGYAKKGTERPRRGRFWVPLLSLYSGMRLNECCQLRTTDVENIDGVEIIHVRPEEGTDKRVKTAASERMIPVHPELVRLGFLKYVNETREQGKESLFPELGVDPLGYWSNPFSKWFARFVDKAGAKEPNTTFHSFRHGFRAAMRDGNVHVEYQNAIGGWSEGASTRTSYGGAIPVNVLAREIKKVRYSEVDLSHLV